MRTIEVGKQRASNEITKKKSSEAIHFPTTKPNEPTGADIKVSNVPNLLSSEKERMVRKGTNAGDPKVNPTTNEERGEYPISLSKTFYKEAESDAKE